MKNASLMMLAVAALVVAACGGGGAATVEDGGQVQITATEYKFEPSEIHLKAGTTVTFVLNNQGEKDHEFMAGKTVHMEDGIPHGFETDFFDTVENVTVDPPEALEMEMEGMSMGADTTMGDMGGTDTTMGDMAGGDEHDEDMGFMVTRQPTESASFTFTVTEDSVGEWEFGCFEEDGAHWDDGMKGTIVVEES